MEQQYFSVFASIFDKNGLHFDHNVYDSYLSLYVQKWINTDSQRITLKWIFDPLLVKFPLTYDLIKMNIQK